MKLSHFFICGMAGVIFVCASLLAADFQSEMPSTNAPRFIVKPAPDISDTFLAWDGNMKRTNMVVREETAHYTFNFTNVSSGNVTISNIFPTCSCTTIQSPQLPLTIAPGNNGQIGVTLNLSNKSGTFFKTILVETDKGSKILSVLITVPSAKTDRARNLVVAQADRQAVFRNNCANCHAKPAVGKFGPKLYETACGICHEAENRASMVPDLHKINQPINAEFWRAWIEHGKPGTLMPAFSVAEGGPLTDTQIKSLTDYLAKAIPSK